MIVKITNFETGTTKTAETSLTVRQYATINACGFFRIQKTGAAYVLIDPFTGAPAWQIEKGVKNCI